MRERIAWWWTDRASSKSARYGWLASVILFVVLYGGGALIALAFGELRAFVTDLRWAASALIIALSDTSSSRCRVLSSAFGRAWVHGSPTRTLRSPASRRRHAPRSPDSFR